MKGGKEKILRKAIIFLFVLCLTSCATQSREGCERWYNYAHPELYGWRKPTPERLKRKPVELQQTDNGYKSRVEIVREGTSYDSAHKQYKF